MSGNPSKDSPNYKDSPNITNTQEPHKRSFGTSIKPSNEPSEGLGSIHHNQPGGRNTKDPNVKSQ